MFIYKKWVATKYDKYRNKTVKLYKMFSLFGIIPLWMSITVQKG